MKTRTIVMLAAAASVETRVRIIIGDTSIEAMGTYSRTRPNRNWKDQDGCGGSLGARCYECYIEQRVEA